MSLPPSGRRLPPLLQTEQGENSPRRGRQKKRTADRTSPERTLGGTARERRRQRSQSRERAPSTETSGTAVAKPKASPKGRKAAAKRRSPPRRSQEAPGGTGRRLTAQSLADENGEVQTDPNELDSPSNETRPKRRRKKKKKIISESQDNLTDNIADEDELSHILGMDVTNIRSDIIDVKTQHDHSQIESENEEDIQPVPTHTLGPVMKSQPSDRLYIEQRKGFKSHNKTVLARKLAANEREKWTEELRQESTNSLELSISSHRAFKTFSIFCHGLLAGLSLCQAVMVYVLSGISDEDFILHYRPIAQPYGAVYYFLCVICTISVFDRYDIAYPNKRCCLRSVTVQSGAVCVVIYLASLLVCNSIQAWDDRLGNHQNATLDASLWADPGTTASILSPWKILNTVRAAGALLGWFIVSLRPGTDRLIKNLNQSEENFIGEEVPGIREMVASCHPPGVYKTTATAQDHHASVTV